MHNIVVLISGNGSNLQAIIDSCTNGIIKNSRIAAVISNKADAYGLQRAQLANIEAVSIAATNYANRQDYDQVLIEKIDAYQPDVIVLAGFMRILSADFVNHYQGRMLNIHPSLLPKYTGLNTHQRAIDAGDTEHGTSVHFVTEELDGGPVILQAKVPIFTTDSVDDVIERVQRQEHNIYPLVIQWLLTQRLSMQNGYAVLDGNQLPPQGYAAQ
ncbi:phosphoribosylglycinamide formyltransferase [Photobacterium iliopiscarium]|jgi:phosphoribosylglycinamide formyltransferase-1|uniref:Phosphoribosylglycinamide formyltransferase n=1 Tax=Photobacterium iliopiscarium TaxID=56192 RepID=A0A0D8PNX4_9GAMM|nr:phosphoribosylglycinamide formyltransferase [Photobacterium iliopiscarium]KJG12250.1 phosphoribosylglycinamide formyltransferase [Photobacterium iliopiscarium]KJG20250.1 phosphoribosylglycinamide formyltransferase [Photobacterium iliopiscarium]PST87032.1 phosphoribosylglycinamide formyltransferase [Photobacterium iliopiscarium]PST97871.1 phosphoribosylglycinamide formyltransferase [Photobacterium iliopiscarium]PSV79768.1 phosphoribosylglycinamide formyltransferase [Photobacterium iliopiscar